MHKSAAIHTSAWKGYSPKFALTEFSEVRTLSLCSGAHTALAHILYSHIGVCCIRYVTSRSQVKAQDRFLPSF